MTYKIGDKVRVKENICDHSDFWEGCSCAKKGFDYLKITENENGYVWDAYDKKGNIIDHCGFHNLKDDDFIPLHRDIEDVQEDDLITDGTYFRRVLGRAGKAVFTTGWWGKDTQENTNSGSWFSIQELKDSNWSIVQDTPSEGIIELTKEEAFEALAKVKGVDKKAIRIKD